MVLGLWTCGRVSGDWVVRVGRLRAHAPNGLQAILLSLTPGLPGALFGFLCCLPIQRNSCPPFAPSRPTLPGGVGGPHSGRRVPWERRAGVGSQGPWRSTALSDAVHAAVAGLVAHVTSSVHARTRSLPRRTNDARACVGAPRLAWGRRAARGMHHEGTLPG